MSLAHRPATPGPHGNAAILTAGHPVQGAAAAIVLCHGRGATAGDILSLASELRAPGAAFIAPQAERDTWYPYSFLAPLERNEPHLSSALALLATLARELEADGVPSQRQVWLGFSQGGCLALEFAGRNARRWGGVVGLSAGLIGPAGRSWNFEGSLEGTPVFLGCDERDPHIPRERVVESANELKRIDGDVEMQIYQGLGHTVNQDEIGRVQAIVDGVLGA